MVFQIKKCLTVKEAEKILNDMEKDGWKLVDSLTGAMGNVFYFVFKK